MKIAPFRKRHRFALPDHAGPTLPAGVWGRIARCPSMRETRVFQAPRPPARESPALPTGASGRARMPACTENPALPTGASGGSARCPAMWETRHFCRPRAQSCGNAVPFHRGNRARPRVCTETPALPTGAFERNCTRCPSTRETRALQPPRPAMQESRHIFARPACIRGKERPPSPLRPAGGEGRSPSIRTFASHENRRRSGGARRSACAARRGWCTPSPPPAPQSRRRRSAPRAFPPERENTRWG